MSIVIIESHVFNCVILLEGKIYEDQRVNQYFEEENQILITVRTVPTKSGFI